MTAEIIGAYAAAGVAIIGALCTGIAQILHARQHDSNETKQS